MRMKMLSLIFVTALMVAIGVSLISFGSVSAAAPANPGCFGTDRAAYANANGSLGNQFGGVGYYASLRAGDNGAINQAYMTSCGGDPTP